MTDDEISDEIPDDQGWHPLVRLALLEDDVVELRRKDRARDEAGRRLVLRAAATVVLVMIVTVAGLWTAKDAGDKATAVAHRTAVDQAVSDERDARSKLRSCQTTNEFRTTQAKALAHTLVPRVQFDATADPTFEQLDPVTQEFVRQLVARLAASNAATDQASADAYAKAFPVVSCTPQEAAVRSAVAKHAAAVRAS